MRTLNGETIDEQLNQTIGRLRLFALKDTGRLWALGCWATA